MSWVLKTSKFPFKNRFFLGNGFLRMIHACLAKHSSNSIQNSSSHFQWYFRKNPFALKSRNFFQIKNQTDLQ